MTNQTRFKILEELLLMEISKAFLSLSIQFVKPETSRRNAGALALLRLAQKIHAVFPKSVIKQHSTFVSPRILAMAATPTYNNVTKLV